MQKQHEHSTEPLATDTPQVLILHEHGAPKDIWLGRIVNGTFKPYEVEPIDIPQSWKRILEAARG